MSERVQQWPRILSERIKRDAGREFQWGKHDCALFAASVAQAITGVDFAADYRGKYADARSAQRIIEQGGGLDSIATKAWGEPIIASTAQRGDAVLVHGAHESGPSLGICIGRFCAVPGLDGLIYLPLHKALKAWRV